MSEEWQRKRMVHLDEMIIDISIILNTESNDQEALKKIRNVIQKQEAGQFNCTGVIK